MSTEELFEKAAVWALQQDRFITSLQLCDQFNASLAVASRLIRKLITHPRITAECKQEKCVVDDKHSMKMLMVKVTNVVRELIGPPKQVKPATKYDILLVERSE